MWVMQSLATSMVATCLFIGECSTEGLEERHWFFFITCCGLVEKLSMAVHVFGITAKVMFYGIHVILYTDKNVYDTSRLFYTV